jgi:hypothetical protein
VEDFPDNSILITGFAQVPQGTTLYQMYKIIGVVWVVDMDNSRITSASFTFVSELTDRFLTHLVKGYDLNQGLEPLLANVRKRCKLTSTSAIIQAMRSCYDRFLDAKNT